MLLVYFCFKQMQQVSNLKKVQKGIVDFYSEVSLFAGERCIGNSLKMSLSWGWVEFIMF